MPSADRRVNQGAGRRRLSRKESDVHACSKQEGTQGSELVPVHRRAALSLWLFLIFQRWLVCDDTHIATKAPLVRRSVDDYVPRPLQLTVYGLVILHLAAWLQVGVTGRDQEAGFWGMLAFQLAISGFLLLVAMSAVRRKPSALDRIVGPGYRRTEVRVAFREPAPAAHEWSRSPVRTDGTHHSDTVDRVLHLGLVAFVTGLAIAVTTWSRQPASGGHTPSSRSLRSLGALVPPSL